jgi:hypothetical protein
MTAYRLLVMPEVKQQLGALKRAAETQQHGGLREREYQALVLGLRAIVNGREEYFNGKRLGYSTHDLSDCAEIKLAVVPETRGNHELGPSHRLIYREFEAEDGGAPYREVIAFEPRKDDRPFEVAAARLGREAGVRSQAVRTATRIALSTVRQSGATAPIRQTTATGPPRRSGSSRRCRARPQRSEDAPQHAAPFSHPAQGRSTRSRVLAEPPGRPVEPVANVSHRGGDTLIGLPGSLAVGAVWQAPLRGVIAG